MPYDSADSADHTSEWLEQSGHVVNVDAETLTFRTAGGDDVVLEGRPYQYLLEQGFVGEMGANLVVDGFYESGEFKAATVTDTDSGTTIVLRDKTGRPGWAGQGRRATNASEISVP